MRFSRPIFNLDFLHLDSWASHFCVLGEYLSKVVFMDCTWLGALFMRWFISIGALMHYCVTSVFVLLGGVKLRVGMRRIAGEA